MTGKGRNKNSTNLKDFGYCTSVRHDKTRNILFSIFMAFPDVLYLGLMLWASSSTVFILQRMQHIHRTNLSPRSSPESRATKTLLLLVSTFVFFYILCCIFHVTVSFTYDHNWVMVNAAAIALGCFPT
jgi:vomeronasal1 receptor